MTAPFLFIFLALLSGRSGAAGDATASSSSASSSSPRVCRGGSASLEGSGEEEALSSVLSDLRRGAAAATGAQPSDEDKREEAEASAAASAFTEAVDGNDEAENNSRGESARRFLESLASSPSFVREYWHRRPLLVRSSDYTSDDANGQSSSASSWADGAFTVERDLKKVGGSYVSGHRTSDALRDGSAESDTWDFRPIKDDAARVTTWDDVAQSLRPPSSGGGTIYFNTAGSLWPSLAALCRLAGTAFGLPVNVNVYVTPPGTSKSVPPHTDRQDVLVIQTEGAKRWRVYGPPKRNGNVDPLNRGKGGDVLTADEMGPPLIDAVLRRGDVLYVPAGFPHATDTSTVVPDDKKDGGGGEVADGGTRQLEKSEDVFHETSVHLTLGLDTHVWGLTYAHMRWSALQRAGKPFQIKIENDEDYWASLETIPCGFLARNSANGGEKMTMEEAVNLAVRELKHVMIRLEPQRWREKGDDSNRQDDGMENLPSDEELAEVARYMLRDHLGAFLRLQREEMFSDVRDPRGEETLMKAYRCTQEQNKIMEKFGAFSKNEAMRRSFEANRLKREATLSDKRTAL